MHGDIVGCHRTGSAASIFQAGVRAAKWLVLRAVGWWRVALLSVSTAPVDEAAGCEAGQGAPGCWPFSLLCLHGCVCLRDGGET